MKIKRALPVFFVIAAFVFAAGCAARRGSVIRDVKEHPASGYFIEGVPFFPQDEYMCGPAAIASVTGYYGASEEMRDAAKEVYLEKLKGTLPVDLLIYAKEKGFDALYYQGGMADLKEKLSRGRPLILFLNMGFESYPIGHYIVAVGYNDRMEAVIAHSGLNREEAMSYSYLLSRWEKTGFSTLLITPKVDK